MEPWSRRAFLQAAGASLAPAMAGRHPDLPDPQFHFNTFVVSWGGTTSLEFFKFLDATKPEIVQAGFYGPMFHGYADNPASTGYMMQLPVSGQRPALEAQRRVTEAIHKRGLKVVAHFQMINVIEKAAGKANNFAEFYEKHWPEDVLGPRPHPDYRELMQRDAGGAPLVRKHYVDYNGLCLNSPHARRMLRQMLKVALDAGVDGIVSNYNYRWGCVCPYCQDAFRKHLAERYTQSQLKRLFHIDNLREHRFDRIAGEIPGYPDPKASELEWEAMRWAALNFKQAYDDLLIGYGRKRKPDLILAQWNHIGDLNIGEERAFTPVDLWGRGENYFWYSGGYGPTKLAEHNAGEAWLDCLYIREMCGGKPFMMGKYEGIRMRNSIAEGVATGGSGMGLQIRYEDPVGFEAGASYLRFLRRHQDLYWPAEPYAEVGLVFPRQSAWARHPGAVNAFRAIGHALADEHMLFDVVLDQKMTAARLARYPVLIVPGAEDLSEAQRTMLKAHHGVVLTTLGIKPVLDELRQHVLSSCDAPWTLRWSAFSQPGRRILHFVNYNRDEAKAKTLKGPAAECTIPRRKVAVDLLMQPSPRVKKVRLLSPDEHGPRDLPFRVEGSRLRFQIPRVVVYAVVEIRHG